MPTCLVDLVRPEAGVAAVRVLRRAGYEVTFPEGQTCCGQPAWNSGLPGRRPPRGGDDARRAGRERGPDRRALRLVRGDDAACLARAVRTAIRAPPRVLERVVEFGAFLAPLAATARAESGARRPVAFHCSCHQRRGLRDTTSGTTLISSLPDVELVEQADADACCGFGGTFAIKFAGVSTAMGRDKVNAVHEAGAASSSRATSAASCTSAAWPPRSDVAARDDDAARAARARGLVAVSLVYGGDKRSRRAPREGARRHAPDARRCSRRGAT